MILWLRSLNLSNDDEMHGNYIRSLVISEDRNISNAKALAMKGIQHCQKAKDSHAEGMSSIFSNIVRSRSEHH